MHDIMRKRLMRKLEALPDEKLYQVLDYIEFLESKYAERERIEPDPIQRFAERFEDRMRIRSLAPRAMSGTMKVIGTAGRVWDNLTGASQGLIEGIGSGIDSLRAGEDDETNDEAKNGLEDSDGG